MWLSTDAFSLRLSYNPGQKSLGHYCNIHIFLSFLGSLIKQCILFGIFLQFSLPPPFTMLKLGKKSGYTRPTLFVGWGEGLDLCELANAPEMQKCPKTFVDDCRWKAFNWTKTELVELHLSMRTFLRVITNDVAVVVGKISPSISGYISLHHIF